MSAEANSIPGPEASGGRNILVVGVGGQGVIMISKVLALIGQRRGFEVKQSEVHGMAKRGGIVFSHVRFAPKVWSPTIAKGEADALIALEWAESLRWLDFLKPETGVFIADTRRIVPPFACLNRKQGAVTAYAKATPADVVEQIANAYALDATGIAGGLGDARAANTVLLGCYSVALDEPLEHWREALDLFVPKAARAINHAAFDAGRAWAEAARAGTQEIPTMPALFSARGPAVKSELEINAGWCKGCDICVKLCPERCLALDKKQIAVLTNPEACTGCRVCEWLCPDFAITVRQTAVGAA
jgi:indolepyruvate ferredoxin oxidoreductase beta subunit